MQYYHWLKRKQNFVSDVMKRVPALAMKKKIENQWIFSYSWARQIWCKIIKKTTIPSSPVVSVVDIESFTSLTRGVEGITRINESIRLMVGPFFITGTESERDMCLWAPFVYTQQWNGSYNACLPMNLILNQNLKKTRTSAKSLTD